MDSLVPDSATTQVSITVLSVTPMRAGKLFALAAVAIDIDGVLIEIHGIRAVHVPPAATRIELPTFRDAAGRSRAAIILPEEVRRPIGDAVLEELVERSLAVRRPALSAPQFASLRPASVPADRCAHRLRRDGKSRRIAPLRIMPEATRENSEFVVCPLVLQKWTVEFG